MGETLGVYNMSETLLANTVWIRPAKSDYLAWLAALRVLKGGLQTLGRSFGRNFKWSLSRLSLPSGVSRLRSVFLPRPRRCGGR